MTSSRVQLALNVTDLDAATRFYTDLFGVAPAKQRTGYANFEVADPPLKLVLFENPGAASPLNHLGVEVPSPGDVTAAADRFQAAGLPHSFMASDRCCHAVQDKVWVDAPDVPLGGWEFYTVLADDPAQDTGETASACCATAPTEGSACCGGTSERAAMSADAVVVEDLHVAYGSTWALDGVDLDTARGTTLGVLGHNGAGKTTLIRVLTTLVRPTVGRVTVDGFDVVAAADQVRRRIGVTGQYAGLDEFLTGRENLELVGRLCGLGSAGSAPGGRTDRPARPRTTSPGVGSGSCRADPGAASTWPPASSAPRPCCSSTNRPPASTPPPGWRCGTSSPNSPTPAPRWC